MKKCKYDIHIHSGLSPCADILLSPNNILNMAYLDNLDIVSITDHNSLKQSIFTFHLTQSYNFLYIIGVEVSTFEGIHVLCYFKNVDYAILFDKELSKLNNIKQFNSSQYLFDEHDNIKSLYSYDLSKAIISIKDLINLSNKYKSLRILAHFDRYSDDIINKIYHYLNDFGGIEISNLNLIDSILLKYPILKTKKIITNSDSHCLTQIGTNNQNILLDELSIYSFFKYFREE